MSTARTSSGRTSSGRTSSGRTSTGRTSTGRTSTGRTSTGRTNAGRTSTVTTLVGGAALLLATLLLLGTVAAELSVGGEDAAREAAASPVALERRAREVTVRLQGRDCEGFTSGTAFFAGDGRLVTSRHVVEGSLGVGATTADGVGLIAAVAIVSADADLAVVAAASGGSGPGGSAAELGVGRPDPGSAVAAAGYPRGGRLDLAHGDVAHYVDGGLFGVDGEVMMITAEVGPGYSGGPLFGEDGRVVGVVFGVETNTGLGLALPIDRLGPLLDGSPLDGSPAVATSTSCTP